MAGNDTLLQSALRRIDRYIRAHYRSNPSLRELAAHERMPVTRMIAAYRAAYGTDPQSAIRKLQVHDATEMIKNGVSIAEAAAALGFADAPHLIRAFRRETGESPGHALRVCLDGAKQRRKRESLQWERADLARHANVRTQYVGMVERSRATYVRPATALALADALGCSVNALRAPDALCAPSSKRRRHAA